MLFLGDGQGGFAVGRRFALPGQLSVILVEDLNGDGRSDLVATGGCAQFVTLALLGGTANGDFANLGVYPLPYDATALASGDVNNDGRKDLAIALRPAVGTDTTASLLIPNAAA